MQTLRARNVHRLVPVALKYMLDYGKGSEHPTGPRLQIDEPVALVVARPNERTILHESMSSNPFYLTMRSLWAMAGRNDSNFLATYDRGLPELVPAPGWRWRAAFNIDQVQRAVEQINHQPVVQVWSAADTQLTSVERNLSACFRVVDGAVNLVVFSGPVNVIEHTLEEDFNTYSHLHEFVAAAVGLPLGTMTLVTTCLWLAPTPVNMNIVDTLVMMGDNLCPYETGNWKPHPVMRGPAMGAPWMVDLDMLVTEGPATIGIRDPYFRRVVAPLMAAWQSYRDGDMSAALALCHEVQDKALSVACRTYLETLRTAQARMEKAR